MSVSAKPDTRYLDAIIGKMQAQWAEDTSDAEIERCLKGCVCAGWLSPMAKELRDAGLLVLDDTQPK